MADVNIEHRVNVLEGEVKEIKCTCNDISDRLIRMEETLKNNSINSVDIVTYNKAIIEMSSSIKILTDKVSEVIIKLDSQNKKINDQSIEINNIKDKPGVLAIKGWMYVISAASSTVLGAVFGYFIK